MKTATHLSNNLTRWGLAVLLSSFLFLGAAHQIINFWEHPAGWMLILFFGLTPLVTSLTVLSGSRLSVHLRQISKKRLWFLLIVAILVSSFMTWRLHRVPETYQVVNITPKVSAGQQVGLLEVKADLQPMPLQAAALASGWREENGAYYATPESLPITLSFKVSANRPIKILFLTSPQSGSVEISMGRDTVQTDLSSSQNGLTTLQLTSHYRDVPNWLLIPLIILADFLTFGVLLFLLLVIQDLGQLRILSRVASPTASPTHHKRNLLVLMALGLTLHSLNALAVPLFIGPDSPSFLQGSLHLIAYGNFDGVSMIRGPGTTFLFAPVMFLFGRTPWGIKILLHLFALACIPIAYRLGWQLTGNWNAAFVSGLVAVFSPDLLFYSNYVMSDVPNVFMVLTFLTLLISALESADKRWIVATMLVGSFAVLLRSENIVMLTLGLLALCSAAAWHWLQTGLNGKHRFIQIGLSFALALLPILWWSAHNLRTHGFFGMSNYQGEVFYDGWVYYGDALGMPFSDSDSPAIQTMNAAIQEHPIIVTDQKGVPTGWEIYPALLAAGYTPEEAFALMETAAWDSIRRNPEMAIRILFTKYQAGLQPKITHDITYPLPEEITDHAPNDDGYFTPDTLSIPALIKLQRQVNDWLIQAYPRLYPGWVLFCILTIFLSLFRSPWERWTALTAITASRIFIPLTLGVDFWRYTLAGWIPAQIIAIAWLWLCCAGLTSLFQDSQTVSSEPPNATL